MEELSLEAPSPLPITSYDGYTICIITLACGHKRIGSDITVLSDLESCDAVPPTFIHVDLPDALSCSKHLPPLDQLPTYNTKTSSNLDLLHSLKIALKMIDLKLALQPQLSSASNS